MQDTVKAILVGIIIHDVHAIGDPSGGQRPLAMLDRLHWWLMRTRDETKIYCRNTDSFMGHYQWRS